jgi:cobalt-zinc-cadmium efflux system protein
MEEIERLLSGFKGVHSTHDLHIWSMDGEHHVLTAHIVLEQGLNSEQKAKLRMDIREALREQHIDHATLELELQGLNCEFEDC